MPVKKKKYAEVIIKTWDDACKLSVVRSSPCGIYTGEIEPGVNFFVLMLERLGAVPSYSCEGHPNGFYITFTAPYALALKIANAGYFSVELTGKNRWRISVNMAYSAKEKNQLLRYAAEAWSKCFGDLKLLKSCVYTRQGKQSLGV